MILNLSEEIKYEVKSGHVKTVDVVTYILDNESNTTTDKPLMETALKDISFSGRYPKMGCLIHGLVN